MTKKLFVVLVVLSFLLTSSLAFGGKITDPSEKPTQPAGTPPNKGMMKQLEVVNTRPAPSSAVLGGTLGQIRLQALLPDTCSLALAGPFFYWTGWLYGDEEYASYQAPENYGCTNVYPFEVQEVTIVLFTSAAVTIDLQPRIYENVGTISCPLPGDTICEGAVYNIALPSAGGWIISLPETCCVYGPYFASVDIITTGLIGIVYPVTTQTPPTVLCYGYNDYGTGWVDMGGAGFTGYLAVWSTGYTEPQNNCPPPLPPPCLLQIDGGPYWRVGFFEPEGVVNYFDPIWCPSPGYPFGIDSVWFRLTTAGVAYPIDVKVAFFDLLGGDSCNGPGREIFSQIFTLNTGGYHRLPLSRHVCVYQPFFGGYFMASSAVGDTFWPNFDQIQEDYDSCRVWYTDGTGWYNWYNEVFGGAVGEAVFRPIGYPVDPYCPPIGTCDTLRYHDGVPYWVLGYTFTVCPIYSGGKFRNQMATKFTAPAAGQLTKIRGYIRRHLMTGSAPELRYYIWNSDGKYATTLIDSIDFGAVADTFLTWREVDVTSKNIFLDDGKIFHVGFTSANYVLPTTNRLRIACDAGLKSTDNTAQHFAYWFGTSPFWMTIQDNSEYYGLDPGTEELLEVEMCYTPVDYRLTISPYATVEACFSHACGQASTASSPTYDISTTPIGLYTGTVNLSVTGMPSGMSAAFVPASGTPPFNSVLTISVDGTVAYDKYFPMVHATGPKGDRTRQITVQVIPIGTYDELFPLEAANCSTRVTNFGAVGNPDLAGGLENYVWFGAGPLFDGGLILATGPDKMAADFAASDGPGKWFNGPSIFPVGSQTVNPVTIYPPHVINMAEGHWADAIGLHVETDEYTIGMVDPAGGGDFAIRAYKFTNNGPADDFMMAYYCDYDVFNNARNRGGYDSLHNMGWIYDYTATAKDTIFGFMRAPTDDAFCPGYKIIKQQSTIWHVSASGYYHPDVWAWMNFHTFDSTYYAGADTDWGFLFTTGEFSMNAGDSHHEVMIHFGKKNSEDMKVWRHRVLRYAGFYRGDVNANDSLEVPAIDLSDLVYLTNYLYSGGPAPEPFVDQGDVNAMGPYGGPVDMANPVNNMDLQDYVYILNYVYRLGPAPIDYVRFIPEIWTRTSLFTIPRWQ